MAGGVQMFWFPSRPAGSRWSSTSGIIALGTGESRTFKIAAGMGTELLPENNAYVRLFQAIGFFELDEETPYRTYDYPSVTCEGRHPVIVFWRDPACSDGRLTYESADGTTDKLFVESPERPFYLERDKQDTDLARLVITFVPSVDSDASESGEAPDGKDLGEGSE